MSSTDSEVNHHKHSCVHIEHTCAKVGSLFMGLKVGGLLKEIDYSRFFNNVYALGLGFEFS